MTEKARRERGGGARAPRVVPRRLGSGLALVLAASPRVAEACAVCFSGGSEETRTAFILTTIFLTALPLLLIGGLVVWFWVRIRRLEAAEARPAPGDREVRRETSSPALEESTAA